MEKTADRHEGATSFYEFDPEVIGVKGLVFVGDSLLVYVRDTHTAYYPGYIDVPGGGVEPEETPLAAFQREVQEEFGLAITPDTIVYARKYPSTLQPGKFAFFAVSLLPNEAREDIRFGNEGARFMLMSTDEYLSRTDAMPFMQQRARDYFERPSI